MTDQPATEPLPTGTAVAEIAQLAVDASAVEQIETGVEGLIYVARAKSIVLDPIDLGEYLAAPRRPPAPAGFTKLDGMIEYAERHRSGALELWAAPVSDWTSAPTIIAVLDPNQGPTETGWGCHRAVFFATSTPDLCAWSEINRKAMGQLEFAEFLEDHAHTLVNPGPAQMLTVAQSIEATVNAEVKTATRLVDGAKSSVYVETITAKGAQNLDIPATFTIGLPIYEGTQPIQLTVRLRYKLQNGTIQFTPIIDRLDEALRVAFTELVDHAAISLGVTAWWR